MEKLFLMCLYISINTPYILGMFPNKTIELLYNLSLIILLFRFLIFFFKKEKKMNINNISIVLFFMFSLISLYFSPSFYYSKIKIIGVTKIVLFYFILKFNIKKNNQFLYKYFNFATIMNILLISFFFSLNYNIFILSILSNQRFRIPEFNTIWISRYICETVLLLVFKLIRREKAKYITILLILLLLLLAISTGSKGPILSLVISSIYFLKIKKVYNIFSIFKIAVFIVLSLILVNFIFSFDFLLERFSLESIIDLSHGGRVIRIKRSLEMLNYNKVLFGYGIGSWSLLYRGLDSRNYPHNLFIEILVEFGILGVILIFYPILKKIFQLKFFSEEYKIPGTLLLYNFINAMFSGDLGTSNILIFAYLGIVDSYKSDVNLNLKNRENLGRKDEINLYGKL